MICHFHVNVHRGKRFSGNIGSPSSAEKQPNLENWVAQTSSQPVGRLGLAAFRRFSFMTS